MRTKHRIEVFETDTMGFTKESWGDDTACFGKWHLANVCYFYWRLRHKNGRKLATSEGYTRHSTALRIARNVAKAGGFEIVDLTKKRKA